MIALSYILTAVGGALLGALLSRLLFGRHKVIEPQPAKSPYTVIPAVAAYERYAAKVEGREQNADAIDPAELRRIEAELQQEFGMSDEEQFAQRQATREALEPGIREREAMQRASRAALSKRYVR